MKKQSLNILTTFLLVIFGFVSLSAQQKGGGIINEDTHLGENTYALVIGISDYQDDQIPDLKYADRDALAFANFLRSPGGGSLDKDHLKVLINEQATMAQFAVALDWLKEVAQKGDKVILYFSGHGDVDNNSISQPGYLLCWDVNAKVYRAGGAMSLYLFRDDISTLSIRNGAQPIVFIDACRSGKLAGSSIGGSRLTATNLAKAYSNELKILSCQPEEYSIEGEQWGGGRGAFSYHLIDGLYGMADENGDNIITLMELRTYLEKTVPIEVAPYPQMPFAVGDVRKELVKVSPEVLEELRLKKQSEMQLFSAVASRGFVEEVLANSDSSVIKDFLAFELALNEKRFLTPNESCAEYYFSKLITKEEIVQLHSTLKREYAAALQDEAQQELNTILKSGLTSFILTDKRSTEEYSQYPDFLLRACELLGKDHYMYPILMGRVYFFKAYLENDPETKKKLYRKSISWHPDMPHSYRYMMNTFRVEEVDSVQFYAQKAMEYAPSWIGPYIGLYFFYYDKVKDKQQAEKWLNKAEALDSNSVYIAYQKGRYYQLEGSIEFAEEWYKKAISMSGSNICFPCAYNNLARMYIDLERYQEAETYLLKAARLDSTFIYAFANLGFVYSQTNREQDALEILHHSISIDSSYFLSYYRLANLYRRQNNLEAANVYYNKALNLDKNNGYIFGEIAIWAVEKGDYEKADSLFKKAIALEPGTEHYWREYGLLLLNTGQLDDAISIYNEAINRFPSNNGFYTNLGAAYIKSGYISEAISTLEKALKIDSNVITTYINIAAGHIYNGNPHKAEYYYLKGLSLDSNQYLIWSELGRINLNKGYLEKAENYFKKSIAIQPNYHVSHLNLGSLYGNNGFPEKAIPEFKEVIRLDSSNPVAWVNLGIMYAKQSSPEFAEKCYKHALQLSSSSSEARETLAKFYYQAGRLEEAERLLQEGMELSPDHLIYPDRLSTIYINQERYEEALRMVQYIITRNPENWKYYRSQGQILNLLGRKDEAEKSYLTAISMSEGNSNAISDLGRFYKSKGDYRKAMEMYREILSTNPQNVRALNNLGDLYFVQGNYKLAEETLNKGMTIDSTYWVTYLSIAQTFQAQERWKESIEACKKAKKFYHEIPILTILEAIAFQHLGDEYIMNAEQNFGEIEIDDFETRLYYAQLLILKGNEIEAWEQIKHLLDECNGEVFVYTLLNRDKAFIDLRENPKWDKWMNIYFSDLSEDIRQHGVLTEE